MHACSTALRDAEKMTYGPTEAACQSQYLPVPIWEGKKRALVLFFSVFR